VKAERRAAKKLYGRIADLSPGSTVEEIGKLAEAYAKVRWGAQGKTIYDQRIRREEPLEKGTGFA